MWYIRSLKQKQSEENAANIIEAKLEIKNVLLPQTFIEKYNVNIFIKKKSQG